MKGICFGLATALLVSGAALPAGAAVKFGASGQWHSGVIMDSNRGYAKKFYVEDSSTSPSTYTAQEQETFFAGTRVRALFTAEPHEYAKANWEVETGAGQWGAGNGDEDVRFGLFPSGAPLNNNSSDFRTRLAWVDFIVPNTSIKAGVGIQQITLPSAVGGNPVFDDRVGSVLLSCAPAEGVDLSLFWARPGQHVDEDGVKTGKGNSAFDLFGVYAGLDFAPLKVSPYVMFGRVGHQAYASYGGEEYFWAQGISGGPGSMMADKKSSTLLVGGLAVEAGLSEELTLKLDAIYGQADNPSKDQPKPYKTAGFMVAAGADYAMPFGTPGVIGWYSSGANKKGEGVLPVVGVDTGVYYTRLGMRGTASFGQDSWISGTGVGTAGVVLQVADMSFLDKLSHTARVGYIMGLNHKEAPDMGEFRGLSKEVTFIELDLDSSYEIAEGLSALLELGYIMPKAKGDFKTAWKAVSGGKNMANAFNGQLYIMLDF